MTQDLQSEHLSLKENALYITVSAMVGYKTESSFNPRLRS